jgi:hypothetical protein
MTRCRAISHAPQNSLRDPVSEAAADDGGDEHRNRTHDYTRMRNAYLRSLVSKVAREIAWRMDVERGAFSRARSRHD